MSTISEFSAPVPDAVHEALAASGAPFDPVGTAILFPEHSGRPDIVVIQRAGTPPVVAELEAAMKLAEKMRCRVYFTFECPRYWAAWCEMQDERRKALGTMSNLKWPSREEWARQRRAMYYDDIPAVSDEFADYASPDEIAAILAELKAHRRTLPPGPSCERSGVNAAIRAVKAGRRVTALNCGKLPQNWGNFPRFPGLAGARSTGFNQAA